jgi:hypothetical protein
LVISTRNSFPDNRVIDFSIILWRPHNTDAAWWLERSCPAEFGKRGVDVNMAQHNSHMQVNLEKIANSPEILEEGQRTVQRTE